VHAYPARFEEEISMHSHLRCLSAFLAIILLLVHARTAVSQTQQAAQPQQQPTNYSKYIPDLGVVFDLGLGWFWGEHGEHIRQGGHSMEVNGLKAQGLELSVMGNVDPYFRYEMHFEATHLEMEEAYLSTLAIPGGIQVRAGKVMVPFGRQNPMHLHSWSFVNPPLSHTRFMGADFFGSLAGEVSWLMPLPWYSLLLVEILDPKDGPAGFGLTSATFGPVDDLTSPGQMIYTARWEQFAGITDDVGVNIGFNGAWGPSAFDIAGRAQLYGVDLYLKWRPVSSGRGDIWLGVTAEYLFRNVDTDEGGVWDNGGYLQFDIAPAKQWVISLRGDYTGIMQGHPEQHQEGEGLSTVVAALEEGHEHGSVEIAGTQLRGSLALSYTPTHFSRIRIQYDIGKQQGMGAIYQGAFLQLEVALGTHASHKY
jgi:hypothetical protein